MKKYLQIVLKSFLFFPLVLAIGWKVLLWYMEDTNHFENLTYPSCNTKTINLNYQEEIVKARRHVQAMMNERKVPGLSISVSRDGQIIWSEAFGYADIGKKIITCPASQYRIQSVSNPLTALAMGKLFEQGKLDMDQDIREFVPEFPDKGHKITPRLLAGHRSGIRDYRDDFEALEAKRYGSLIEGLDSFKDDPLQFTPGTRFQYSTYNYWLLNAVIERASVMPFPQYMEEQIFKPLGMSSTTIATSNDTIPNQVHFYDHVLPYSADGSLVPSPAYPASYLYEISTADDLVRFANSLTPSSEFIKKETQKMLFKPQSRHMFIIGYSMGWMTTRDLHLRKTCFHFGAGSGGTSVLVLYPEQRVAIAMLANLGHARFPFNRLSRIANQFTCSPGNWIFWMIILAYALVIVYRFIR